MEQGTIVVVLRALLGVAFFIGAAWLLSSDRARFQGRAVLGGVALQFAIAFVVLETAVGTSLFQGISNFVSKLISMAVPGAQQVFGSLADPAGPAGFVFAFAATGLVLIIFISALFSILYHVGLMQLLVWALAKVMSATLGISGGEAMAAAANIFMGQAEAPMVVKPYVAGMTKSELNALMTGGFATIAGSMMAVYMSILGPEYASHIITASVMSAPASFTIAKLIVPETEKSATAGGVQLRIDKQATNAIEAATNGALDGLKLWLNVMAMLIAFIALVNLVNWPLGALSEGLSLAKVFGWIFAPVAWLMGVEGWHDCRMFGTLLGTQISINEFVGYQELQRLQPAFEHERSVKMAIYALCGFANFASIGIQIGGISAIAPERKKDLASLALKAMLGGALACWMTATVAGAYL